MLFVPVIPNHRMLPAGAPDARSRYVKSPDEAGRWLRMVGLTAVWLASALLLWWISRYSYLLYHSLVETFTICVGFGIFAVAWNARRFHANTFLIVLGVAYLSVAVLTLLHMLAYQGMAVFPHEGANLPTQLWLAARGVQVVSLVVAPLLMMRRVWAPGLAGVYAIVTTLLIGSIFAWSVFPEALGPDGLTTFKIVCEYVFCGLILAAAGVLWWRRRLFDRVVLRLMLAGLLAAFVQGFSFTLYGHPFGFWNWLGHLMQALSGYLIYRAVVVPSFDRPYALLLRDLKQNEDDLREAGRVAEQASRAKDRFLAVLSHELRNPLNPVLVAVSSLEHRSDLPADVRDDLRLVRRNVELECRLIDDLLDLTRIARGKLELHPRPIDVRKLLDEAVEICRADVAEKRLVVDVRDRAPVTWVEADPVRLMQVLWNVLKNAVKFSPPAGTIRIGLDVVGDDLRVSIADEGPGIEAQWIDKVFEPFAQEDETSRDQGGLGLGLAISKGLVEAQHGTIGAASAGRGRGATFTVALPTCVVPSAPAPADAASGSGEAGPATAKGLHILLVEDHADTAKVMSRVIRAMGHRVTHAPNAAAAVRAAETHADLLPFDLVLSDLGLPDSDGRQLMRVLRNRFGLRGIALSGYGMDSDVQSSHDAGFDEHLTKPVDLDRLMAAIDRVTASHV